MNTYISILRGINVNSQNIIKMDNLRESLKKNGYNNITTYIQSGNIVFSFEKVDIIKIKQDIVKRIQSDFGLDVPVIVLTIESLKSIIKNNPLVNQNLNQDLLHITFLSSNIEDYNKDEIEIKKQNGEEIIVSKDCVYLYCPFGYGKTKLTNIFLESKLGVIATTRNWKTSNELLKIAERINK
jgi:uncharacterized protein (DUF1697 family)